LDGHAFDALMSDEARLKMVHERVRLASDSCLPAQLRLSGDYPRLWERAAKKEHVLAGFGGKNLSLEAAELTEEELFRWYFEQVLGRTVPADISAYAERLGFTHPYAFRRVLLKEFIYRRFEPEVKVTARDPQASGTARHSEEDRTLDRDEARRG
jgi:hypothetical protein